MLDTSARLLRLLVLLYSRGHGSGRELAERLEITERTLRRDIDRLRSLGYPIRSSVGIGGGYRLEAGVSLPPLVLEDDEALAVILALRTVAAGNITGVENAALRALVKLEQVLPSRIRKRFKPLHKAVASLYPNVPSVAPDVLLALAVAHDNRRRAVFHYRDKVGRVTTRAVEPHGLVHTGTRWYLVAWDEDRHDWRTFRVDRIEGDVSAESQFAQRQLPEGGIAAYVSRSVASSAQRFEASVVFFAPLARVQLHIPPLVGCLKPIDAQRCHLTSGAQSLEMLAIHIMLVGEEFEIEEPPELVQYVRDLSARLHRATQRGAVESKNDSSRKICKEHESTSSH